MSLPQAHLVSLNAVLSQRQLSALKVAVCYGLCVPERLLETAVQFSDVNRLVADHYHSQATAVSVVVQILSRIGVPERYLFSLREKARQSNGPYVPDLIREQPLLDLILTVNNILDSLSENKYRSLKELAFRMFFPQSNSSVITSRTGLVEFLLRNNILSLRAFDYVFAWLEVIGSSIYRQYLARFCDCQRVNTPNWKPLLPAVERVFSTNSSAQNEATNEITWPLSGDFYEALSVSLPIKEPLEEKDLIEYGASGIMKQKYSSSKMRCRGCFFISMVILLLAMAAIMSHYAIGNTAVTEYIGANTSVLINFKSHFHYISNITISKAHSSDDYNALVYLVFEYELDYITQTLPPKDYRLNGSVASRHGLNYYYVTDPVYTAKTGQMTYHISTWSSSKEMNSDCPLQFHLFDNVDHYTEFHSNGVQSSVKSIASTGCLSVQANNTPTAYMIEFSLPSSGFYFVGVSMDPSVFLNATIDATLTAYDVSGLSPEDCSLDSRQDSCDVDLSHVSSLTGKVRVLVSSGRSAIQRVSLRVSQSNWNKVHLVLICVCTGITFALLVLFTVCNLTRKVKRPIVSAGLYCRRNTVTSAL